MGKKPGIVFVQLPLLSHDLGYTSGNIEYGPAAIAGYLKRNVDSDLDIVVLPYIVSQIGSDAIIVKYILSLDPAIVGFTCYLWNIERALVIAEMIKMNDRGITVVFGGPEINCGSIAFARRREYVDYFVIGEGEWFFSRLLAAADLGRYELLESKNRIIVQPDREMIPASDIYEPFTGKRLNPMPDGSMYFELTRGCPYKCSYCLYSKNYPSIREIPFHILITAITDNGLSRGLQSLYILSPALDASNSFVEKLNALHRIHHSIPLHSEMRGEGVDARSAKLLFNAGFRSMEVGLQTLNRDSLKIAGRMSDPENELKGIRFLKEAGIDVKIGVIPGLPRDGKAEFIDMIDRLACMGFEDNIELYPLMILPGTRIRELALNKGVNFGKKPPYFYHYGWGASFEDMIDITRYTEQVTGYSHITKKLPDFVHSPQGAYVKAVYFNGNHATTWTHLGIKDLVETSVFSIFIYLDDSEILYDNLQRLLRRLPVSELFNIIIISDVLINEHFLSLMLQDIYPDHIVQRMNIFHDWRDGTRVKLYQVFNSYERYQLAKSRYTIFLPVMAIREANFSGMSLDCRNDNILMTKGVLRLHKEKIISLFSNAPESVAFEDEAEQAEFYNAVGYEYANIPFRLKSVAI
jgi:radical SAM superfamily enzyme YgiQ (UPF0313 family)